MLRPLALPALCLLSLAPSAAAQSGQAPLAGRPNLLVLVTDDQRHDALGVAGNDVIRTPHLDALAAEGTRFRNAYVTTPICCTSRASLFTGQHAARHGVHDFRTPIAEEAWAQTYPGLLRAAGYQTCFVGKYGVASPPGGGEACFDFWYGFGGQGRYELTDERGEYQHLTRKLRDDALAFLAQRDPRKPFCLSISFKAPHVQDQARAFLHDRAYDDLYADLPIPRPATATAEHFGRLAEILRSSEARVRWEQRFDGEELRQETVRDYYRLITGVDDAVGSLLAAIEEAGLGEDTVVVFTSDNGFYLGEHGLAGKWYAHEESVRVPLIVVDPRRAGGRVSDAIALNVDLAPTLLDLAGVPAPDAMQGRSLVPLLDRGAAEMRADFLFQHLFAHAHIPRSEGVVGRRWKYARFPDSEPALEWLFDLAADPHEERNLASDPAHGARLAALRARTAELVALRGAPAPARTPKVLLFGVDGLRLDALREVDTPHLDALAAGGALLADTAITTERYTRSDTISGPGWSSILCGVWADKHGVDGNTFGAARYGEFPTFLARVEAADPARTTAAFGCWQPLLDSIVPASTIDVSSHHRAPEGEAPYPGSDEAVAAAATAMLRDGDPDALLVYFGHPDGAGHRHGYGPAVAEYVSAVRDVDRLVGDVLAAVRARPTWLDEDWLVLVATDHGGRGTGHSGGRGDPVVAETFLIASGPAVDPRFLPAESAIVDVAPTALAHLGLEPDPAWNLDGRSLLP